MARPSDFDIHMQVLDLLDRAEDVLPPIMSRLETEMANTLGEAWAQSWHEGLPDWDETPGEINMRWILRLRNLAIAFDMLEYGKMRYNMIGNGGHWFPGANAEKIDEIDLSPALKNSPHADAIPGALAEAHALLAGQQGKRLQEA